MTCIRARDINPDSRIPAALPAAKAVHFPGQLSKGAIAGIVVGCVLGVAIVVGAGWWFWRKYRKQSNLSDEDEKDQDNKDAMPPEMETDARHQLDGKETPGQLDGAPRAELGVESKRQELFVPGAAHELQGSVPISYARRSDRTVPRRNSIS